MAGMIPFPGGLDVPGVPSGVPGIPGMMSDPKSHRQVDIYLAIYIIVYMLLNIYCNII